MIQVYHTWASGQWLVLPFIRDLFTSILQVPSGASHKRQFSVLGRRITPPRTSVFDNSLMDVLGQRWLLQSFDPFPSISSFHIARCMHIV